MASRLYGKLIEGPQIFMIVMINADFFDLS